MHDLKPLQDDQKIITSEKLKIDRERDKTRGEELLRAIYLAQKNKIQITRACLQFTGKMLKLVEKLEESIESLEVMNKRQSVLISGLEDEIK
ncbi:hypothetical protein N7517_006319 [Penicillium concentricum]|uniref:Uncharacterized protein n=1 Tax=Penicillium concentricum TaxID=293559 RepID=A0A9W9S986_9EURO|nr:uncharacterized protein N7517_006319 [Penicillium concentricum]KAJ5374313.1 hypothetical protein N7517_006319 [Penicillium concentricum]